MADCPGCRHRDEHIASLERHVKALEAVLENSRRSLAAEGRLVRKTRQAVTASKEKLNAPTPD